MSSYDILVLGATGFTGQLAAQYLFNHPQLAANAQSEQASAGQTFTFAIGARSQAKLDKTAALLKQACIYAEEARSNADAVLTSIPRVVVDVTDAQSLDAAVRRAKVVLNCVGPYWRWGTPVVRACVRHGVHYVDLTGESPWVKDIITEFDYVATRTNAIIVPGCGMDSIPSDLGVFLSSRTLEKIQPHSFISSSISAYKIGGGVSGGTLATILAYMNEIPKDKVRDATRPYALSPCEGPVLIGARRRFQLVYRLPHVIPRVIGAFFVMSAANRPIVERSWGLLEMEAKANDGQNAVSNSLPRYGPNFFYDECLQVKGTFTAVCMSLGFALVGACLTLFSPARWLFAKIATAPGQGPSLNTMRNGFLKVTNVTTSSSNPPVAVKSTIRGRGDPGYCLSAIMLSESALSLLLHHDDLPALAKRGGVLTTATAMGDVLIDRLVKSPGGRFSFESEEVDINTGQGKSTAAAGHESDTRKDR